jgi:tight adherence protein B
LTDLIAALAIGGGLALAATAFLQRAKERDDDLASILDLPFGEQDVPVEAVTESRSMLLERGVSLAQNGLEHFKLMSRVQVELERARVPLRPGEFVLAAGGVGFGLGFVMYIVTAQLLLAVLSALAGPYAAWSFVKMKVSKRRKAFEAQLPEALGTIAASMQAGHTALRAIQGMVEEAESPIKEEFERVVAETALGDPLVDALERMANRLQMPDLSWVVQAIRIQQTVGGKLADLLYTLAEFMRQREEIRREVRVLTAEGRMSAYVLGALPVVVFFATQTLNPGYLDPMMRAPGLFWLIGAGVSVVFGISMIMKMVRIHV